MKAILYCRTDGPQCESMFDTLNIQRACLMAYAEKKGMEIAEVYMDAGYSGRTLDRPGLKAVIQAVREGRADTVLVANRNRLFRDRLPVEFRDLPIHAVKE